jgi:membrane protein YqaA with SNARE-associated domain
VEAVDFSPGTGALFASAFISATLAPGASEAVLAFLITRSDLPLGWLLFVATTGNTLGALTTWLLGLLAASGYPLERITQHSSPRALYAVRRWGIWALLGSWLPVIGDALCLAAGWLRLPLLPSLIAITVGKAARYAVVAYVFM